MCSVYLLVRPNGNASGERCCIENLDLSSDYTELIKGAAQHMDFPPEDALFLFGGKVLENAKPLEIYGIKPGSTVHVYRDTSKQPVKISPLSPVHLSRVQTMVKLALTKDNFRKTMEKLKDGGVLSRLVVSCPALSRDGAAQRVLMDPAMWVHWSRDANIAKRVHERHPVFFEALHLLLASLQEGGGSQSSNMPAVHYSLDSSDDEMDLSQDGRSSGSSGDLITATQLASALAHVAPTSGAAGITSDMFNSALQQAMTASTTEASSGSVDRSAELQQLRDMGITDDDVSLRALEATNGDVQQALELIFGEM